MKQSRIPGALLMAVLLLLSAGCGGAPAAQPASAQPEYPFTAPPITFTPAPTAAGVEVRLKFESSISVKQVPGPSGVINVPTVTVKNTDTQRGIFVVIFSVQNPPNEDLKFPTELDLAPGETKTAEWTTMPQEKLGWKYLVEPPVKTG